jgi:hypothetical protein
VWWEPRDIDFRLGGTGRGLIRRDGWSADLDSAELLRTVVVPACRSDVLRAAQPYRLWSGDFERHTSFSLISALLGLLDEDLRTEPFGVDASGMPEYRVKALALELVLLGEDQHHGQARPSLDQARRLYEPARNYAVAEHALTLADAGAASVTVDLNRRGDVHIVSEPAPTRWGDYDHALFMAAGGGNYDEPELVELFNMYAAGSPLPPLLHACSEKMRIAFGFGVGALLHLCHLAATIQNLHPDQNFIVVARSDLLKPVDGTPSGPTPEELTEALHLLVFEAAAFGDREKAAPLTLPTGPSARLVTRPLVAFGPHYVATTPELIKRGSIQLLRHLLDGRLPNGETPRPGTDLALAFNRLRQQRTGGDFEQSVRSALAENGFTVYEFPTSGPITAQIDAVVVDPIAQVLWVVSVKDPLFPFRPQQAMEHLQHFFADYLPQLERNVSEVTSNLDYVWHRMTSSVDGSRLPSANPGWPVAPAMVCRDTPVAVAVRNAVDSLPPIVLRRHLPQWRPGGEPPIHLNPVQPG